MVKILTTLSYAKFSGVMILLGERFSFDLSLSLLLKKKIIPCKMSL